MRSTQTQMVEATARLVEANQRYPLMEEQMRLMQQQLQMVLDNRTGGNSTGTSQVNPL